MSVSGMVRADVRVGERDSEGQDGSQGKNG